MGALDARSFLLVSDVAERHDLANGTAASSGACYVIVCRGPHCRERGSMPLRKRLVQLLRGQNNAKLLGYHCFGQCDFGPNVAFYPEGTWYGGLNTHEAAEQIAQHAQGARMPDEKRLVLPDGERRLHLQNIADLVRTVERDAARPRRWWWPF